jgi:transcription elongation GreA/GreB family factor
MTASSPLGQALVRHQTGDTITYHGPDGELEAEVVVVHAP